MRRAREEPAIVRVYTVCDESKYLIVRNVPSLGCGEELKRLFESYGPVEECKPMDAEDCEAYTDVFFIKFFHVSNARFAKRKLDESVFIGNKLDVKYAPHFETHLDTKEKLDIRKKEVLGRIKSGGQNWVSNKRDYGSVSHGSDSRDMVFNHVSSNQDYFPSASMNNTVKIVRDKLDKIESGGVNAVNLMALKKPRRRI